MHQRAAVISNKKHLVLNTNGMLYFVNNSTSVWISNVNTVYPMQYAHLVVVFWCVVCCMVNSHYSFSRVCFTGTGSTVSQWHWNNPGGYAQCRPIPNPGARFTNGFPIAIQIRWKFHFTLISIIIHWSLHDFVHGTTAVLSWHVQKFVAIGWQAMELQRGDDSIEFELRAKNR